MSKKSLQPVAKAPISQPSGLADIITEGAAVPAKAPTVRVRKPRPRPSQAQKRQAAREAVQKALAVDEEAMTLELGRGGRPDAAVIREAFINFETAVGGREALLDVLTHCPPASLGHGLVQRLLTDSDLLSSNAYTLQQLCKKHKIPFNLAVQAYRDAKLAKMAIETLNTVAGEVPEVVQQLVTDSKNRWDPCPRCEGEGRIQRMTEYGEFDLDSNGSPVTQLCFDCRGKGRVFVKHDFQNRSRLLDLAGLRPDRVPLVQQTFNQQATIGSLQAANFVPGDGSFESLMRAVENTLRPTLLPATVAGEEVTIDAEIVQSEAPAKTQVPEAN